MHSNFITPPDFVETIAIIDATDKEIEACGNRCRIAGTPYNVYLYSHDMDNLNWLAQVIKRCDTVLQAEGSTVPALGSTKFGPNQFLKQPEDYFNK